MDCIHQRTVPHQYTRGTPTAFRRGRNYNSSSLPHGATTTTTTTKETTTTTTTTTKETTTTTTKAPAPATTTRYTTRHA